MLKWLVDLTSGQDGDPRLVSTFPRECDVPAHKYDQIVEGPIAVSGVCEHHVLPIEGLVYIAIVGAPAAHAKILGISTFERIARWAARRWADFHVGAVLHEGGPRLSGAFLKAELVDELFLTIAPQVAGRNGSIARPGLMADVAFAPREGRWTELQSVRIAESHLFLHLSFKRHAETAALGTAQHGARGRPAT